MELPLKINPCPIKEAVVELRFEPSVDRDAVFGILYQKLKETYIEPPEKLPILQFPEQIRESDPDLRYQPYYRFKLQNFFVRIGPNVVSVSAVIEYPGWNVLREEFLRVFRIVVDAGIVETYSRFAVRYINQIEGDVTDRMKWTATLGAVDITKLPFNITFVIEQDHVTSTLRFNNDAKKLSGEQLSIIDIDSVLNPPIDDFEEKIVEHLDAIHLAEKEIFFSALKEEYLKTLSPEYAI